MEDSNRLYDTIRMNRRRQTKSTTNQYYGESVFQTMTGKSGSTIKYSRSSHKSRLRGTITEFTFEAGPTTYENPWDAEIWRKWQGRAEEFWDARLQGRLFWEQAKNGSTRDD